MLVVVAVGFAALKHCRLWVLAAVWSLQRQAEKAEAIKTELKEVNEVFYCELCDKQYTKVCLLA